MTDTSATDATRASSSSAADASATGQRAPGARTADLLAADTGMGAVTLRVADLDAMTAYYRDAATPRP